VAVQVVDTLMQRQNDNDTFPISKAKRFCLEDEVANLLVLSLGITENIDFRNALLDLFLKRFDNWFYFETLKKYGKGLR